MLTSLLAIAAIPFLAIASATPIEPRAPYPDVTFGNFPSQITCGEGSDQFGVGENLGWSGGSGTYSLFTIVQTNGATVHVSDPSPPSHTISNE